MRAARCRDLVAAAAMCCSLAATVQAQGREPAARVPAAEIGVEPAALVRIGQGKSSETMLAFPGASLGHFSGVYASLFVTPQLALEPSVMYLHVSSGGSGDWMGTGTLRAAGYGPGAQLNSAYVFLEAGVSGGSGYYDGRHAFGGGAGYRWLVAERHVALRLEGFYRRWSDTPVQTEVGLALRAGVVVPRAR